MAAAPPPSYTFPPVYAGPDDSLPDYECTLSLVANLMLKLERDDPLHRCRRRAWSPVTVAISGPQMTLSSPSGLLQTLSLQVGSVGLALDYTSRSHVLRIRLEGRQFLLAAGTETQLMRVYTAIEAGVDLAAPLEGREMPKQGSVPTRREVPEGGWSSGCKKWWRERIGGSEDKWFAVNSADEKALDGRAQAATETKPDMECRWSAKLAPDHDDGDMAEREKLQTREKEKRYGTTKDSRHAWRCARVMYYDSAWRSSWYFRDGLEIQVPAKARICFDELYGFGMYANLRLY